MFLQDICTTLMWFKYRLLLMRHLRYLITGLLLFIFLEKKDIMISNLNHHQIILFIIAIIYHIKILFDHKLQFKHKINNCIIIIYFYFFFNR